MPHITSIERQARAEGLEQGRLEGKRHAIRRVAWVRFGVVLGVLEQQVEVADDATLDTLLDRVVRATSADDV